MHGARTQPVTMTRPVSYKEWTAELWPEYVTAIILRHVAPSNIFCVYATHFLRAEQQSAQM